MSCNYFYHRVKNSFTESNILLLWFMFVCLFDLGFKLRRLSLYTHLGSRAEIPQIVSGFFVSKNHATITTTWIPAILFNYGIFLGQQAYKIINFDFAIVVLVQRFKHLIQFYVNAIIFHFSKKMSSHLFSCQNTIGIEYPGKTENRPLMNNMAR